MSLTPSVTGAGFSAEMIWLICINLTGGGAMRLAKVSIGNFRSIQQLDIELLPIGGKNCSFFIGMNETGKSNILKAIKLLGKESLELDYSSDCEKNAKKKDQNITIEALYEVTKDDGIEELIAASEIMDELKPVIKITSIKRILSVDKNMKKTDDLWFNFDRTVFEGFYSNEDIKIFTEAEALTKTGVFEPLNTHVLDGLVTDCIDEKVRDLLPDAIFWKASPEYLITGPISLSSFASNPGLSIPLKNIFGLDGKLTNEQIKDAIDRISLDVAEKEEYEVHLSDIATRHINTLWPEHKINLRIRFEGDQCFVFVEDKETKQNFDMLQRSDGFKHFISILLTLSVQVRTNGLKNKIILLDEPETSLHPSSIKYLRDELLNISKTNCVMVATHSIFMVDRANLDRHFSVSRSSKSTEISRIDPSNPLQEEVIYESLGTSILDILEPNMLIFEGRTDKDIFDCFSYKLRKECGVVSVKTISAQGADNIPKYIKFFNKKLITGYVLLDSDKEGRKYKKELIKSSGEMKDKVFEISDMITSTKEDMSLEDLYPNEIIEKAFSDTYGRNITIDESKSVIDQIKKFKHDIKLHEDEKLEDFKFNAMSLIIKDTAKTSIENVKVKYSLLCNLATAIVTKIRAAA